MIEKTDLYGDFHLVSPPTLLPGDLWAVQGTLPAFCSLAPSKADRDHAFKSSGSECLFFCSYLIPITDLFLNHTIDLLLEISTKTNQPTD